MNIDKILKALVDSNHDYIGVGKAYKIHPDAVRKIEKRTLTKPKTVKQETKITKTKKKVIKKHLDNVDDFIPIEMNNLILGMDDKLFLDDLREARTNGINKLTILIKSEVDPVRLVTAINKIDEILKRHSDTQIKEEDKDEFFKLN